MSQHSSTGKPKSDSAAQAVADELRSRAGDFDDPRIVEIVMEYEEAIRAGERPRRADYINRFPELSSAVATCLDGVDLVYGDRPLVEPRPDQPITDEQQQPIDNAGTPLGDFRIVRELARGGMGVVYEAVQLSLGRRVALKVLPFAATIDERQLQRFKLEAQAAALLHHNHIVPVYAVGCERGVHYYAMQLIEGQSLAVVIQQLAEQAKERQTNSRQEKPPTEPGETKTMSLVRTGPDAGKERSAADESSRQAIQDQESEENADLFENPGALQEPLQELPGSTLDISQAVTAGFSVSSERFVRRAVSIIAQAAEALEHAHQAGVVHRDIKPANLLVDKASHIWITDFGLAQIQADLSLTRSGDMLGTLRYMSPEQAGGNKAALDHRTDIYSLGATLYELLTLSPFFSGESQQELLYQILNDEPRGLREKNRAVPSELETVVLKSLCKNPSDRYQSAADFAADLRRFLDHQPVLARRPTLLDRTRKWSRRHPSVVVAGVMMLGVIIVALLISNRLISEEQKKTDAALNAERQRANEAEQSFQQARDAVYALFQISEEELAGQGPDQDVARRRILEVVLSQYEEFIEQRKDDPESQAELERDQETVERILHELTVIQQSMRIRLLEIPAVREELALTDEQEQDVQDLNKDRRTRERALMLASEDKWEEADFRTRMIAAAEENERQVMEILTGQQETRFHQIAIQSMRMAAFKEPEVVAALELTPEQRREIRAIERSGFGHRGRSGGRGFGGRGRRPGEPPERFAGDQDPLPSATSVERVLSLLNDRQRQAWNKLVGEPFMGFEGFGDRRGRRGPRLDPLDEE